MAVKPTGPQRDLTSVCLVGPEYAQKGQKGFEIRFTDLGEANRVVTRQGLGLQTG